MSDTDEHEGASTNTGANNANVKGKVNVNGQRERHKLVEYATITSDEEDEYDEVKQVGKLAASSSADLQLLAQKKSVTIAGSGSGSHSATPTLTSTDGSQPEVRKVIPSLDCQPDGPVRLCELDRTPTKDPIDLELNLAVWKMNYREAAIYLCEGERNDPFSAHPSNRNKLNYYFITHSRLFNGFMLAVAVTYMALAFVEGPGTPAFSCSTAVKVSIELICLAVFSCDLIIRFQWMGQEIYMKHGRTILKTAAILCLLLELTVYYSIGATSGRYLRVLRPLFVVDNYYARGQRRFIRQVIGALRPVVTMVFLLLFVMTLFTLLGYYLFCQVPNNPFFETLQASFISLFVLLTTANFPDVMMPAYAHNQASVIFFVTYLCIEFYLLMNLLFAVVYNKFSQSQLEKLQRLYIHRHKAAEMAFDLLTTKALPGFVTYHHFEGMMRYYRPKLKRYEIYLTFKAIDDKNTGQVTLQEFCHVYEACHYNWELEEDRLPWWHSLHGKQKKFMRFLFYAVESRMFTLVIYAVIISNTILIIIDASNNPAQYKNGLYNLDYNYAELGFAILYGLEAVLKILALGPTAYFHGAWHVFDFSVTTLILLGQVIDTVTEKFPYSIFLRPVRLLRLLKVKKLYREVLSTTFTLLDRFGSVLAVVVQVYYIYGIIGINVFGDAQLVNCCNGSIADYYRNGTGYYQLNNFNNIFTSSVTLFELTVVNNWYVIMEAYCQVYSEWARVFFMLFYLNMMILINMVVSFILGAFMFRMQYTERHVGDTIEDRAWVYEEAEVNTLEKSIFWTPFEVKLKKRPIKRLQRFIKNKQAKKNTANQKQSSKNSSVLQRLQTFDEPDGQCVSRAKDVELNELGQVTLDDSGSTFKYKGTRKKQPFEFNMEMHESDLKSWLNEEKFMASLKCAVRRNSGAAATRTTIILPSKSPFWSRKSYWLTLPRKAGGYVWKKGLWLLEMDKQEVEAIGNLQDLSRPETAEVWTDDQVPQFSRKTTIDTIVELERKQSTASSSPLKSILKRDISERSLSTDPEQSVGNLNGDYDGKAAVPSFAKLVRSSLAEATSAASTSQPRLAALIDEVVKREQDKLG